MLQKVIKFVRENFVAILGIAAIVLSCIFMVLPEQFAHLMPVTNGAEYKRFSMSGYEFIFNSKTIGSTEYNWGEVVPAGIALIVLFVVGLGSFIFAKKSSALLLLGGLANLTTSILMFSMEASAMRWYKNFVWDNGGDHVGVIGWVAYVCGALLILSAAYAIYKSILIMKDEIKKPSNGSKGPSYNYLKK